MGTANQSEPTRCPKYDQEAPDLKSVDGIRDWVKHPDLSIHQTAKEVIETLLSLMDGHEAHRALLHRSLPTIAEVLAPERVEKLEEAIREIRFHVKSDPQMERTHYYVNRTGAAEIARLADAALK